MYNQGAHNLQSDVTFKIYSNIFDFSLKYKILLLLRLNPLANTMGIQQIRSAVISRIFLKLCVYVKE
jgi:hypothetical protein